MSENYVHKKKSGKCINLKEGCPEGIEILDYIELKDKLFIKSKYSSAENKLKYDRNEYKAETHNLINNYIENYNN